MMKTYTITLDENEFDLLRFFVDSFEDDYTEGRDDTIGDENAEDVYERLQNKLSWFSKFTFDLKDTYRWNILHGFLLPHSLVLLW